MSKPMCYCCGISINLLTSTYCEDDNGDERIFCASCSTNLIYHNGNAKVIRFGGADYLINKE